MKLKNVFAEFFKWEVHDGKSVSFWLDNWLDTCQLLALTGDTGPIALGVARNSTVAEAAGNTRWNVRRCRTQTLQNIVATLHATPISMPSLGPDIPLWKQGPEIYTKKFSTWNSWNQILQVWDRVICHKSVWFPQRVPRFSFIVWLAIKDRLSTGVRIKSLGW